MQPATEYSGCYAPPFGPFKLPQDQPAQPSDGAEYQNALYTFHLERLSVYASDSKTWSSVDLIIFETLPLLTEALAIRKAMYSLERERGYEAKPFLISFTMPSGKLPQSLHASVEVLDTSEVFIRALEDDLYMSAPFGIGVNCFNVRHIQPLLDALGLALLRTGSKNIWIWVAPNGGQETYDPGTKLWTDDDSLPLTVEKWTDFLTDGSKALHTREGIDGIIVGGVL